MWPVSGTAMNTMWRLAPELLGLGLQLRQALRRGALRPLRRRLLLLQHGAALLVVRGRSLVRASTAGDSEDLCDHF